MKIYNGYDRLPRNYTLLTDEYEYSMANGYLANGKENQEAVSRAMEAIIEPVSLYDSAFNDGGDTIYLYDFNAKKLNAYNLSQAINGNPKLDLIFSKK